MELDKRFDGSVKLRKDQHPSEATKVEYDKNLNSNEISEIDKIIIRKIKNGQDAIRIINSIIFVFGIDRRKLK